MILVHLKEKCLRNCKTCDYEKSVTRFIFGIIQRTNFQCKIKGNRINSLYDNHNSVSYKFDVLKLELIAIKQTSCNLYFTMLFSKMKCSIPPQFVPPTLYEHSIVPIENIFKNINRANIKIAIPLTKIKYFFS